MRLTGVERIAPTLGKHLKQDERRRVAYLLCRGGRFGDAPAKDAGPVTKWQRLATIWNEKVGTSRNAISGKRYTGCPTWHPPRFADGSRIEEHYPRETWPMRLISSKSHLQSMPSIGRRGCVRSILQPDRKQPEGWRSRGAADR